MPTPKRVDELTTGTPGTSDWALFSPTGGPSKKCAISTLLALGGGGVSSLNALTGALSVAAGTGISVSASGSTITVSSTVSGGVSSVNSLAGALTLAAGTGISVSSTGSTITVSSTGTGGVSSVNTLTGALTIAAGTGIGVTSLGSTVTLANNGVTSVNTLTGALTLAAGSNITLTPSGSTITIAASGGGGGGAQTINAQTGTAYTLVLGDAQCLITLNNASAITLTIPPNSSVAFPVGTGIDLMQLGAGQVTVAGGAGVTLNATPGTKLRATYSGGSLIKLGTNTWVLVGDTTT